jgi:hypothetical protein
LRMPALNRNTLVDCTLPAKDSRPHEPVNITSKHGITIINTQVAPVLLAGWGRLETGGCWSDGDTAYLYVKAKSDTGNLLLFQLRSYRSSGLHFIVNGKHVQDIVLSVGRLQEFTLKLPESDGSYLIECRIDGAVAPSEISESEDSRRLGVHLKALLLTDSASLQDVSQALAKPRNTTISSRTEESIIKTSTPGDPTEVEAQEAAKLGTDKTSQAVGYIPAFPPLIMDFSLREPHPNVSVSQWFDEEIHGRWSRGASGHLRIRLPDSYPSSLILSAIFRLVGLERLGPRSVHIVVDGNECGRVTISDDEYHCIAVRVPDATNRRGFLAVEFRSSNTFNLRQNGISDDARDLGLHLRSAVLAPAETGDLCALLPGMELVSDPNVPISTFTQAHHEKT